MAKEADLKKSDFKKDVKSGKGLLNPLKELVKKKPQPKKDNKQGSQTS